jgi:DNA-binding CsgD family transcriptional regulator
MPGKVPRGSLPFGGHAQGISSLGRFIFDKLDRGVALLDANGAVVDANTLAAKVLGGGQGVSVRNGRLAFDDATLDERFVRLLASSRGIAGGRPIAVSLGRSRGLPCRVVIVPATPHGSGRGVRFVALIYSADASRGIATEVLAELYGLTRAQANVARCLYAGHSVEETAALLELSPNTVRTHLKQIFAKCEVQSQAELLHMLATGPQHL